MPEIVGGPSKLLIYDHSGTYLGEASPAGEPILSIDELVGLERDALMMRSQSFLSPPSWYKLDEDNTTTSSFVLKKEAVLECKSPIDTSAFEVVREFATSKDGTRIPMNLIRRKGTTTKLIDGNNPTLLYGYGGYGISLKPTFTIHFLAWLDLTGGLLAVANLRGGGEYGEEWHKEGMLTKKQNVFDDFIACGEYLIEKRYTTKEKLLIEGGSNGGLLMGAALTQRPDLFGAVVSHVGDYDMLRVEIGDNGAFTATEYGTVKDEEQFKALYAYSPYHRVVDGTNYPAVLLLTGENDHRVDPWQSMKMTARLQAATKSGRPILLRIDNAGHGFGTALDQRIAQDTDVFSFAYRELGLETQG